MTTLVTGASGFVGAAIVRDLLRAGHDVRVLVRPTSDRRNLGGLDVDVRLGDLLDPRSLEEALSGCRHLFHAAAEYRLWHPRPRDIYAANVTGTTNVMSAALAAGVERVVYTSSVATLGIRADREPADETTPSSLDDMVGHYKRSKFLAEEEVRRLVRERVLPAVIVNPSTPVGPGDVKPTPTGRLVLDAARGRMPAYVETGLNVVHVDDVAAGHRLALERGRIGERYILGSEDLSLRELLGVVAALTGRRPPRLRLAPGPLIPLAVLAQLWARMQGGREPRLTVEGLRLARKHMYFRSDKARRELGYDPRPAREALRDAVEWFRRERSGPGGEAS